MITTTPHDMQRRIDALGKKAAAGLHGKDFLLTWDKSREELEAILEIAAILKEFRRNNISPRLWDSGLAVSQFRDNSTRTRFSFASACNLLGLTVSDLDEGKSQIAHGETVRETANMISFMAEVIGIRDDMYIGKGHTYMVNVAEAVEQGYRDGVLEQRPTVVNLQCDIDHPTQTMADLLHLVTEYGGRGKAQGEEGGHELGVLAFLRQAALRAAGGHRPFHPVRDGRVAWPTRRATRSCRTSWRRRGSSPPHPAGASTSAPPWRRHSTALTSSTPRAGRLLP